MLTVNDFDSCPSWAILFKLNCLAVPPSVRSALWVLTVGGPLPIGVFMGYGF